MTQSLVTTSARLAMILFCGLLFSPVAAIRNSTFRPVNILEQVAVLASQVRAGVGTLWAI